MPLAILAMTMKNQMLGFPKFCPRMTVMGLRSAGPPVKILVVSSRLRLTEVWVSIQMFHIVDFSVSILAFNLPIVADKLFLFSRLTD